MSWTRIRTVVRGAQAAIESEPKYLAALRPIVEEALLLLSKPPTQESRDEVRYLLTKIQEFVIQWRPSPQPRPGVLYIQPNWAKSTDSQATEALALLDALPRDATVTAEPEPMREETTMKVFVSHSSADQAIAEGFVELLRAALNLSSKDIRCTSVAGYKLPAGADSNEHLRTEVFGSNLFVALLSPTSMKSIYVMFELGARWGTKRHLAPIMVAGTQPSDLKAPLSGIHSIDGTSEPDLHQLLADMGTKLSAPVEGAATYGKALHAFVNAAKRTSLSIAENNNMEFENWERDIHKYEPHKFETGALAFILKPEMQKTQPVHYICANCVNNRQIKILQPAGFHDGESNYLRCPICGLIQTSILSNALQRSIEAKMKK